jgi:SCY1-like protein 2
MMDSLMTTDATQLIDVQDVLTNLIRPWNVKQSKMAQPDLDYIAPEIQMETVKVATTGCDVFSLGMFICSVYNNGRSILQAAYSPATYMKQIERVGIMLHASITKLI